MISLYSTTLQLQVNIVYLMNLYIAAYPCSGHSLRRQNIGLVLFMGDFNLPDEDWANSPAINGESLTDITSFSITNSFTQLVTEPTHKDGNVSDLIFSNFNDPEILCIEKHLSFSDHYSVSLGFQESNQLRLLLQTADLSVS